MRQRGEYRLARGLGAQCHLDAMALAAMQSTGMMSEQVWDGRRPTGRNGRFDLGEPTFSARPLAWTHAQFLRLARSGRDGVVGRGGVEPPTFRFSAGRSYQLSYLPAEPGQRSGAAAVTRSLTARS